MHRSRRPWCSTGATAALPGDAIHNGRHVRIALHEQLVEVPHQRQHVRRFALGLVVERRPIQAQQAALPTDIERGMALVDHSPPSLAAQILAKACCKKSFSAVSWPIPACSSLVNFLLFRDIGCLLATAYVHLGSWSSFPGPFLVVPASAEPRPSLTRFANLNSDCLRFFESMKKPLSITRSRRDRSGFEYATLFSVQHYVTVYKFTFLPHLARSSTAPYSTVTLLARLRGWSTSLPR